MFLKLMMHLRVSRYAMERMQAIGHKFGGPAQYLRIQLDSVDAKNKFTEWLLKEFPMLPDHHYTIEATIPPVTEEEMAMTLPSIIQIAAFSFSLDASVKPFPDTHIPII